MPNQLMTNAKRVCAAGLYWHFNTAVTIGPRGVRIPAKQPSGVWLPFSRWHIVQYLLFGRWIAESIELNLRLGSGGIYAWKAHSSFFFPVICFYLIYKYTSNRYIVVQHTKIMSIRPAPVTFKWSLYTTCIMWFTFSSHSYLHLVKVAYKRDKLHNGEVIVLPVGM